MLAEPLCLFEIDKPKQHPLCARGRTKALVSEGEIMVVATQELSSFPAEHAHVLLAGPHDDLSAYCLYLREDEIDMNTTDGAECFRLVQLSCRMIEAPTQAERVAAAREFLLAREDYGLPYLILAREGSADESEAQAQYLEALESFQTEYDQTFSEDWEHMDPYFMEDDGHCLIAAEVCRFLWRLGKTEEALEEILVAVDTFGDDCEEKPVYTAISWLIQMDRDQEARLLIDSAPSADVEWFYAKALLLFRSLGDTAVSRAALQLAVLKNRLIGGMILNPSFRDDAYDQNDREDVQIFVDDMGCAWHRSSGSQEWLARLVTGEAWRSCLDDNLKARDQSRLNRWKNNFDLANKFSERKDIREARRLIRMAVREAEQIGYDSRQFRKSLTTMIEIFQQASAPLDEVVEILERQVAYLETACSAEPRTLAVTLQGTVHHFAQLGMDERGADLLQKSLRLIEKSLAEGDSTLSLLNISRLCYNLAICFTENGRHAEAEPLLRRSISLEEEFLGQHHPDSIPLLRDLMDCLHQLGKYTEEAEIRERLNALDPCDHDDDEDEPSSVCQCSCHKCS